MEKLGSTTRDENGLAIANDYLRLVFASHKGSPYLSGLGAVAPDQHDWIAARASQPAPLWKARFLHEHFLPPDASSRSRWDMRLQEEWIDVDSFAPAHFSSSLEKHDGASVLTLCWEGIALAGIADTVDVAVQVALAGDSRVSRWSARVDNHAIRFGLWQFTFPVIGNLVGDDGVTLVVPAGWGKAVSHPAQHADTYTGHYPSGGCVLQLVCLTDGNETLYLAAEDPQAYFKRFELMGNAVDDTIQYAVVQYPNDMGYMRNSYTTPYPVSVGVLPGDWYAAAKTYRAWALTAPWTAGGKIETRTDTEQWIKDNVVWANCNAMDPDMVAEVVRDVSAFARYLQVPAALHWYSWHQIPFDDHYPEYFPTKPGFKEAVAELQKAGVHVMPYINGRLWDSRTESWFADGAADACSKDRAQRMYVESYASRVVLTAMCPTTPLWQNKISGIVERLAGEYGVDGVYIDQIGAASPNLCFDRTHGHGTGGGDYWVLGYEKLLALAKAKGKATGKALILTTEDASESYGAQLDAFLMCNSTQPGLVPLYPAIYSGIFLTFGRYMFEEDLADPAAFRTKLGQMFLWGAQLCWMAAGFILKEQHARDAAFLRELAHARADNQAYLAFGELVQPPRIDSRIDRPLPEIRTKWCMWNPEADFAIQPMMDVTMSAVEVSAWHHSREDRWGLFFVNMAEQEQEVAWSFPLEAAGTWQAREQRTNVPCELASGDGLARGVVKVPALGVRVVELFKAV
ncbi:MAG: DUF6259 domain-containing protein [Chloroflexi bacterium]|nr:DUF6259 domain-containing protein [Chloroflexota bacterium]